MSYVIGLDIGTTSTVGILLRLPGEVAALASRPVTLQTPHPGWAEEDPEQWWANACAICRELIAMAAIAPDAVVGIGVAGMLPALILLDAAGEVLRPSIQQSDGRCGAEVAALRAEIDEAAFLARTGNGVNQQLVAPRLRWIAAHEPAVFARIAHVLGSYDYINWRLTGTLAVEQNWALEAGFTDIATGTIDVGLIALAGIAPAAMPPRSLSHAIMGRVSAEAAAATGLGAGTPVIGGAADMVASALGAGVIHPGDVLIKLGGAVDILTVSAEAHPDPRMFLDYHLVPGRFMPNGCMSTGGAALNWFARNFGAGACGLAEGATLHARHDALAAARPAGSDGLTVLPYFLGEKTPLHDPAARGMFEGLTLTHDLGHLWRALLESYGYAIRHHLEVLREIGYPTVRCLVSDGGAISDVWVGIIADIIGQPLQRLTGHPGSCLGVAWAAAVGTGLAGSWEDVRAFTAPGGMVVPDRARAATYDLGYRRFRMLYERVAMC